MEFSDIIIIILLMSCLLIWFYNSTQNQPQIRQCSPQIIYKFRPDLDLQFDSTNFPSTVYSQMFNGSNIAMGGYNFTDSNIKTGLNLVTNQNNKGGTISPVPISSLH